MQPKVWEIKSRSFFPFFGRKYLPGNNLPPQISYQHQRGEQKDLKSLIVDEIYSRHTIPVFSKSQNFNEEICSIGSVFSANFLSRYSIEFYGRKRQHCCSSGKALTFCKIYRGFKPRQCNQPTGCVKQGNSVCSLPLNEVISFECCCEKSRFWVAINPKQALFS